MTAKGTLTAARVIARRLAEAGCTHAFGIPGGEILTLMEALRVEGIDFRLCRHENAGGFMAEGVHHATGAPGVLVATVGPGVANAVNVVTNAYQDQVPMIFLTGCIDPQDTPTFTHQVFDHGELVKSVTKASFTVAEGAADEIIDKAVAIALDDRPGPVHVDVPIRVAEATEPDHRPVRRVRPAPVDPAPGRVLDEAQFHLARAERPVMIAGIDVLHHDAADDLRIFLEDFPMPVITTYKAKGVIPEDHPLALGAAGLSPRADDLLLPFLKTADLVICAGYDPIEMRIGWRTPWHPETTVIDLSAAANTHYVHQATCSFVCHIGAGLDRIRRDTERRHRVWPGKEPEKLRNKLKKAFAANGKWGPAAVVEGARAALPRDAIAAVDTGAHRILFSQAWESYVPRGVLQSTALCTMGVALPMAMGRKLAEPGRAVVAFTGDGGLEMVLGELASLRDMGLAIPIIVFVDESLALIEKKQRAENNPNLAVDFGATDFVKVARAMGGKGTVADTAKKVESAVRRALKADTFTVIACPIGRKAYDGKI